MIKIKIDKSVANELLLDVTNILLGNGIKIMKDEGVSIDLEKPMSKENSYSRIYGHLEDGKMKYPVKLVNEKGDILVKVLDVIGIEHLMYIKTMPFKSVENKAVKEIYFSKENSFILQMAEEIVSLVGGEVYVEKELIYKQAMKNAILKSYDSRSENNKDYYDENNKVRRLQIMSKEDLKKGMEKYSSLNNNDEALSYVNDIYTWISKNGKNQIVIEERKKDKFNFGR